MYLRIFNMSQNELPSKIAETVINMTHPEHGVTFRDLRMPVHADWSGEEIHLSIETPDPERQKHFDLEAAIRKELASLDFESKKIKIKITFSEKLREFLPQKAKPRIRHYIAVASGKGGVGKSTVSSNLAVALAMEGWKVGLVDLDIYGPSLGKMFGMPGRVPLSMKDETTILPIETNGIKLMSFSFLLNPDQAVIWRGPMLGSAVQQMIFDVDWGELDYLIMDLPPGTGDVQLSLSQQVEMHGAVIVTTPQTVASMDASRAISMFEQVKIPVLGVIENMTEFVCPHCGKTSHLFEGNAAAELEEAFSVPKLGGIPMKPVIMQGAEKGTPAVAREDQPELRAAYKEIISKMNERIALFN